MPTVICPDRPNSANSVFKYTYAHIYIYIYIYTGRSAGGTHRVWTGSGGPGEVRTFSVGPGEGSGNYCSSTKSVHPSTQLLPHYKKVIPVHNYWLSTNSYDHSTQVLLQYKSQYTTIAPVQNILSQYTILGSVQTVIIPVRNYGGPGKVRTGSGSLGEVRTIPVGPGQVWTVTVDSGQVRTTTVDRASRPSSGLRDRSGQWQWSLHILSSMQQRRTSPDVACYNASVTSTFMEA